MKTLKDHTILYDDECPMCALYTGAFIKTGMLDNAGREKFSDSVGVKKYNIDWDRARNEIALINRRDQSVRYGIDSLTFVLGHSMPFLKPLMSVGIIKWMILKLYMFISYNRKVIAPGKIFEGMNACVPDYHRGYRWTYILFAWFITSLILMNYSILLQPYITQSSFAREFLICGGQVVWQGVLAYAVNKDRWVHYLGNMMTVSLGGAVLLWPILMIPSMFGYPVIYVGYFILVVFLMLLEHIRRVKILEMPWYMTASWVLYRIVVLGILISLK